jgi:hypothetical protein
MKWFSEPKTFFRDYIFKNLFDYYYKANDTYQDSEGKGILERFIEVCSSYFDNEVMPDIDNFMDCLDVDKTNPIFLNYLWEYFGFIPYSYGVITKGEPYTEENLERWLKEDRGFPTADCRSMLRYAISLYKIRGTKRFYEILGKFYGVTFILTEVDEDTKQRIADTSDGSVNYDLLSHFDSSSATFDTETGCWECVPMILTINIPKGKWDYMIQKDQEIQEELLNNWKLKNPGATDEEIQAQKEIIAQEHPSDYSDRSKNTLISIVNKYLPVNVKYFESGSITVTFQETTTVLIVS